MVATVTRMKETARTVHYFERDGYYAKSDPAHRLASRWEGDGAAALGLRGPVKPKRFEQVLQGWVPGTDRRLGRLRDGRHEHLPGVDVTFSAPKSVSLEGLVYASPRTGSRVVKAHDEAVRATLRFVEAEFLMTRSYDRATGRRPRVKANGMVAAAFRHVASRNLDPQLHTHCVIANMTRDAQGTWRSAEFTALERAKRLIGAHYRKELRKRLEALGYAAVATNVGDMPGFEIAGYRKGLLDSFSTRRTETLKWLTDRGEAYSPARMKQAVLYTRRRKSEPDREELEAIWRSRARELGPPRDMEAARGRKRGRAREAKPAVQGPSALGAAWREVERLQERRTAFPMDELRARLLGELSLAEADAAIDRLRRDGHLVEAGPRVFATDRGVAAEKAIVARSAGSPVEEARFADPGEAARAILRSPGRVVGALAGVGKIAMFREAAALDRRILGVAPTARAARTLEREAGIRAQTLRWFLARYRDIGDGAVELTELAAFRGAVLLVDEASTIGAVRMRALIRIAEKLGVARVVLIADRRQLWSAGAGQPFRVLWDAGMPTVRLAVRRRDTGLKAALRRLIEDKPDAYGAGALEMDSDELAGAAAQLWLDADDRDGTAIVAPTIEQQEEIVGAVRAGLAAEGVLHGPALELERYVDLRLTRSETGDARNWQEGDVAIFRHDVYGVGARAGDACRIAGAKDGRVSLEHPDGRTLQVDPPGYIRYRVDLHETRPIMLQAGDAIRWTRDDAERELLNGARAEILKIGGSRLRLRTEDGREVALPRGDPQLRHLDHAYASSARVAEGLACDSLIAVADSDRGPLEDQAAFYRTRARDGMVLLTDDREALTEALESGKNLPVLPAARLAPKIPDRPAATDEHARRAEERRGLEADRSGVAELPGYGAWRRRAEEVGEPETERALRLDDPGLLRDWRKDPSDELAEAYAAEATRPVPTELVRLDRRARAAAVRTEERRGLEADRAETPVAELSNHAAWHRQADEVAAGGTERALRLAELSEDSGKSPVSPVARALDAPRREARADSRLAVVRTCAARRERLLERAGKSDRPFASGFRHWRWRRAANRAETAGRELLERGDLDDRTRREIAGVLEEIERSRTYDVLPARILRGLRDNAARAEGADPRLTAEYGGLVLEMELLPPHPKRDPLVRREVAAHAARREADRFVQECAGNLRDCVRSRVRLAKEAADMGVPLVAHYGYGSWRNDALRTRIECRKVPDGPAAAEIRRGLGELDRLLGADEPERKKTEGAEERRQASRGMSL